MIVSWPGLSRRDRWDDSSRPSAHARMFASLAPGAVNTVGSLPSPPAALVLRHAGLASGRQLSLGGCKILAGCYHYRQVRESGG